MTHAPDDGTIEPQATTVLSVVPVTGAAISTLGALLGSETVSASNDLAARLDELQFDLGVGPCWDALASSSPVLEPDLRRPRRVWPGFSEAIEHEEVAALFAFPLIVGPLRIGAMDLYHDEPRGLAAHELAHAVEYAGVLSRQVLRRALAVASDGAVEVVGRHSRRTVHQATGFVIAQVGVSAEDAELLIQASAFAEGRPVQEIAEQIVERRRAFGRSGRLIEEQR